MGVWGPNFSKEKKNNLFFFSEMREKKKSHPNNFHPVGANMQITDQRGLEWKLARLGENIIKLGLYMCVQDVRETCWTQVMELTCT